MKNIALRIPEELAEKIKVLAKEQNRSINGQIITILEEFFK